MKIDDTTVCPPLQLKEAEEREKAEEQRLLHAIQTHEIDREPEQPKNDLLVYLEG